MANLPPAPPVTAEMNYLGDQADRPFFHTTYRDRSRMVLEPREVVITDARGAPGLSFEDEGFMLVADPLPASWDLRDQPLRDGDYLVHLRDRIQAATGAARVISDVSVIRLPDPDAFQVPVLNVHADFTDISARNLLVESWDQGMTREDAAADLARLIAESIGAPAGKARYRRVLAINAWRPITDPPHDRPLALCAKNSIAPADLRVADFREELSADWIINDELLLCRPDPAHRWYQFSDMRQDELLLFVEHDFADPAKPPVMHSAFVNPRCPPGTPGRASVEVRAFAFFD
jgi:hypothetical protein